MFGGKKKTNADTSSDSQPNGSSLQSSDDAGGLYQSSFAPSGKNGSTGGPLGTIGTVTSAWSNPVVQNIIHTMSALSDVGAALPYISPAFVLVRIIIDVEQKARDADAKCNDLLERITFMLGHLTLLKDIQVTDTTQRMIERMNGVLENATSLIQAYRKQGAIARRLNTSNRNKFISCVESINACSNDLMMALQIHQTGQLNILTRSVPTDLEDEAAQDFIAKHGGIDAIKEDRELVARFASQLHLTMDDHVMEQINTNLTDLMKENQIQLERMLKDNVGTAVVDGIKELAVKMAEFEKEQTFKCVQCDKEYRNSTNGPASCSFHRAEYSSWSKNYPCCSTSHPCQFRSHRATHHCEYPYGTFFPRSFNVLNYVDTVDTWATVEDKDLKTDTSSKATIGRLLRWVSRSALLDEQTILITVGSVWYTEPYFFDTFTIKDLESIAAVVSMTRKTVIFRTSTSESQFAMAEWVLSPKGVITGVRLTAKAASSDSPYARVCPIDAATCTKTGDTVAYSEGGLCSYNPRRPHSLLETIRIGPELSDKPLRATRTDFKTRTSPELPVLLKVTSEPPLRANPQLASTDSDYFEGDISIFNKNPAGSTNPITIASIKAFFRLVGDEEYTPVKSCKINNQVPLPATIEPRQSLLLTVEVNVPRSEEDASMKTRWWNRAFIARKRPLRLKVVFEDIEGEECSLVLEYIYTPYSFTNKKEDDLGFLFFDDPDLWTRNHIQVKKVQSGPGVVSIDGNELNVHRLHKVVYHAVTTGETEVDLKIGKEREDGLWEWAAWALVDLSCRRVYAFKILLKSGRLAKKRKFASLGYVRCPSYGEPLNEVRPISYAVETNRMPKLEPFVEEEIVADDTVDDFVPEPPKPVVIPAVGPSVASGPQMVLPDDVTRRLASIDESLSRIATSIERLVDVFAKQGRV